MCSEDSDALAYIDSKPRYRKDYEKAIRFVLNDPLNKTRDRKRPRLTKKKWRDMGLVYKYRIPSGEWRFFYVVDTARKCIDLIWAGSHTDSDRLG